MYGATSNKYFAPYFSPAVAESITSTGQAAIRFIGIKLDKYLNKILKTEGIEYVVYQDTDSVAGDSVIVVNGERIKIEDYFERINGKPYVEGKMVLPVNNDFAECSFDGSKVDTGKINYVMAHKTHKKMFRVHVDGKSVDITEDHSIMVMRDGVLCEAKPEEVKEGDKLVCVKY